MNTIIVLLLCASILATTTTASQKGSFTSEVRVTGCEGLYGEVNVRNPNTIVQLNLHNGGKTRRLAKKPSYVPSNQNPRYNWLTNIIDGISIGALLELEINEYIPRTGQHITIGTTIIDLPTKADSWRTYRYGSWKRFG